MKRDEPTQSEIALRDILSIGSQGGSQGQRIAEAIERVERYESESRAFHEKMGSSDVEGHVKSDLGKLRDRVISEIQGRPATSNSTADVLERIWDHLVDLTR